MTEHRRLRRDMVSFATMIIIALLLLASVSSALGFNDVPIITHDHHLISVGGRKKKIIEEAAAEGVAKRRRMGGPGSSPPTCRSKCGSCSPCTAVHVSIHPGLFRTLEYYPEAWRCQCGNKLFMP